MPGAPQTGYQLQAGGNDMNRGELPINFLLTWTAAGIPAPDILKAMTTVWPRSKPALVVQVGPAHEIPAGPAPTTATPGPMLSAIVLAAPAAARAARAASCAFSSEAKGCSRVPGFVSCPVSAT